MLYSQLCSILFGLASGNPIIIADRDGRKRNRTDWINRVEKRRYHWSRRITNVGLIQYDHNCNGCHKMHNHPDEAVQKMVKRGGELGISNKFKHPKTGTDFSQALNVDSTSQRYPCIEMFDTNSTTSSPKLGFFPFCLCANDDDDHLTILGCD